MNPPLQKHIMAFKVPNTPDELLSMGSRGFNRLSRWIPYLVIALIIGMICLTSFYTIDPDEVGVIRQFGKYARTTQPGLHWKIPLGVEALNKVKVTRVFKEEFGFRTGTPGVNTTYSNRNFDEESIMLTGDLNSLDVSWIVQYKISDPVKYLFTLRNPEQTLRDLSESGMRQEIGDSSFSEALTVRRIEIDHNTQERLQAILDHYDVGIRIELVKLQDVNPPDPVKPSFNEVNEAKQEKEKVINQAFEAYNKLIPKARGEAEQVIRSAEGYALARVKRAQGDASQFTQTWDAYKSSRDVTRRRMYLETLREVLPKAGKVYVFDPKAGSILPLLNLTSEKQ